MINKETLEALLMDKVFEALSPEVTELLDAYISEHPEYQPLAESIKQTAILGQKAVSTESVSELPSFPKERIFNQQRTTRYRSVIKWCSSMAACILIGLFIGAGFIQRNVMNEQRQFAKIIQDIVQDSHGLQANTDGLNSARAFWSTSTYSSQYEKIRNLKHELENSE